MSNPDLSGKSLTLRQQASQGDLAAMTVLLNHALAHKNWTAKAHWQGTQLEISVVGTEIPDQVISVTLVCRELQTWKAMPGLSLSVSGQQIDTPSCAWEQAIAPHSELNVLSALNYEPRPSARMPAVLSGDRFHSTNPSVPGFWQALSKKLSPQQWRIVAASLFLALLILASGQLTFLLSPLLILIHELGHAACGWFFGYPSIPALDFMNGGGITLHGDRYLGLVWIIYLGMGYLLYACRRNLLLTRIILGTAVLYTICAFTAMHQVLFVLMGHCFELIFAGIFLYRGVTGSGCRHPIEQPLYGMVGFFSVFYNLRFAWGLMFDPVAREIYEQGKGGILDHDLVRLSGEYLHVDLSVVVGCFLICILTIPALVYWGLTQWQRLSQA
jgi:hypothetical protein